MQIIKYNLISRTNTGTLHGPVWEESKGIAKSIQCRDGELDANLAIAKQEAWKGEVTVIPGEPDPEPEQTPEERMAELEEALELLLSEATE